MYQRDYLMNEARKFAQLLAKLMGLKAEGHHEEFNQQFSAVMQNEYDAELEELLNLPEDAFKERLQSAAYSAEKMNAFSQLLCVFAEPFAVDKETASILKKVLVIFDVLEQKHHFQTFENIEKRNTIYRYFKDNYE